MSVYLYDSALVETMRTWNKDQYLSINSTDTLFSYRADVTGTDKVSLPALSLTRLGYELLALSKQPINADGYKYTADSKRIFNLRGVPIRIRWQLDILTKNRQENDNIMREIILKLIAQPTMEIQIPYNQSELSHKFNVHCNPDIIDNSEIPEHLERGEYFRSTIELYSDDAYLFNYVGKNTRELEIELIAEEANN